jgi:hypothetical protein
MAPEVGLGLGKPLLLNDLYSEKVANPAFSGNYFFRIPPVF